jgi:uncharacterized protein (DUF1499 family)
MTESSQLGDEFSGPPFPDEISRSCGTLVAGGASVGANKTVKEKLMFAGKRPGNIGVREGRLVKCPAKPNCVSSQSESSQHQVDPLVFSGSSDEAMARLRDIVARKPGRTLVEDKEGYLYFECASKILGFVDDLEFLCQPDSNRIDVRSASRLGYSDMGVNRKRVQAIRKEFEEI